MDHEREIHQDIQSLHSDMWTLVYDNYNKFVLATDTIGKVIITILTIIIMIKYSTSLMKKIYKY